MGPSFRDQHGNSWAYALGSDTSRGDLVGPATAASDIFYVAPNGNDRADGRSVENAWKTLERASEATYREPAQILLQAHATFTGRLSLGEGPAVHIGSFGKGRARIRTAHGNAVSISNRSATVSDLEIVGTWDDAGQTGADGHGVLCGCHLDGNAKLAGLVLRNLSVSGFRSGGITIAGGGPNNSRSGFDGVLIEGCEAFLNGSAGITMCGQWLNREAGWCHRDVTVRRSVAHRNSGLKGLKSHTGSGIVISDLQFGVIEDCLAYENGANNDFEGGGPVGIWCWDCDSVAIRRCVSHSNRSQTKDGGGFDLDGGCTHCVIEHCYSYDNAGSGILLCQYNGARPYHHNTVRSNRCVFDGRHNGGGIVVYDDFDGISDCVIEGNHCTQRPSDTGHEIPAPIRVLTPTRGLRVFGNRFETLDEVPVAEIVEGQVDLHLHDNWFSSERPPFVTDGARKITDLAEILDILGYANSVD